VRENPSITDLAFDCSSPRLEKLISEVLAQDSKSFVIVFAESASNPLGRIFWFEGVETLKKQFGNRLWFIIDNSWTTALGINPFDHKVDVVVEVLNKYFSGGGKENCGVVLLSDKSVLKEIRQIAQSKEKFRVGTNPKLSDFVDLSNLFAGSLDFEDRMTELDIAIKFVIGELQSRKIQIVHPFDESHPSFARRNLLKLWPAVLLIERPGKTEKELKRLVKCCKMNWNISFGGKTSRIAPKVIPSARDGSILFRFALGYEDDQKSKLEEIVAKLVRVALQF